MEDVRQVGNEIKAVNPKIDALVNNAGLHAFEQRITSEGFAEMLPVNYLVPWLLTHTLQQSLVMTGGDFNVGTGTLIVPVYPGGDITMQNKLWNVTKELLQQSGFIESIEINKQSNQIYYQRE